MAVTQQRLQQRPQMIRDIDYLKKKKSTDRSPPGQKGLLYLAVKKKKKKPELFFNTVF